MKITKIVEKKYGKEITKFFVDDVLIAESKKYKEWYCTIKNGTPSNIRDRMKFAKETNWNREGLVTVLGEDVATHYSASKKKKAIFQNDYPDLTWGDAGSSLTPAKIKACIEEFKKKIV